MSFERWEVCVALFPFVDAPVRKPRPVVILSQAAFNRDHGHGVVAMITTAAAGRWLSDYAIIDLAMAGLRHASVVRWRIFTLPYPMIARRIGRFGAQDAGALTSRLGAVLGGSRQG